MMRDDILVARLIYTESLTSANNDLLQVQYGTELCGAV